MASTHIPCNNPYHPSSAFSSSSLQVGKHHEISAGLLIGGKDVKEEQSSVSSMNILVATPGRLLQHMDETPGFDASALQILVGVGNGEMCRL